MVATASSCSANFFLVGAPKCGTTSIAKWLERKPSVSLTHPKEPFFWADELRGLSQRQGIDCEADYNRLFPVSSDHHIAIGEASTLYLSSASAVANLAERFPEAKLICMFRNPIDVAHAFHMQALYAGYEDEPDFEVAWRMSQTRASGKELPKACPAPSLLDYQSLVQFGSQLQRLYRYFDREQVLCCFFSDLLTEPAVMAGRIEAHLRLPNSGDAEFPTTNSAMVARSRLAISLLRSRPVAVASQRLKRILPYKASELMGKMKRTAMRSSRPRKQLSDELKYEISDFLETEIALLEDLVDRRLQHWRPGSASRPRHVV